MSRSARIWIVTALMIVTLVAGVIYLVPMERIGDVRDVSNDPQYGSIAPLVGRWRTKTETFVIGPLRTWVRPIRFLNVDKRFYSADVSGGLLSLPPGSDISIDRLNAYRTGGGWVHHVDGTILSGELAGQTVSLNYAFFVNNGVLGDTSKEMPLGPTGWAVKEDLLERVVDSP